MKRLFAVTRSRGKAWDPTKGMRLQKQLANSRFVILGGPLGEGEKTLLVVDAADEAEIRSTLARDPWTKSGLLEFESIQLWTVLLQAGQAIRAMPDARAS